MEEQTNEWVVLTTKEHVYEAHVLKEKLENAKLPVVLINKRDSAYGDLMGYVEVMVRKEDAIQAQKLIIPETTAEE